jgi:hypothetical protein
VRSRKEVRHSLVRRIVQICVHSRSTIMSWLAVPIGGYLRAVAD